LAAGLSPDPLGGAYSAPPEPLAALGMEKGGAGGKDGKRRGVEGT